MGVFPRLVSPPSGGPLLITDVKQIQEEEKKKLDARYDRSPPFKNVRLLPAARSLGGASERRVIGFFLASTRLLIFLVFCVCLALTCVASAEVSSSGSRLSGDPVFLGGCAELEASYRGSGFPAVASVSKSVHRFWVAVQVIIS